MEVYLDAAYIVKIYLNDPDSGAVQQLVQDAGMRYTSAWSIPEVNSAFHRHTREGWITRDQCLRRANAFADHVNEGFWTLIPIRESLLKRTANAVIRAPRELFLRAGDTLHIITAQDLGLREIWTNDRHMLRAAPHFGLTGRSVRT